MVFVLFAAPLLALVAWTAHRHHARVAWDRELDTAFAHTEPRKSLRHRSL